MHVTFVSQIYKPSVGGVQQLLGALAEGLADHGDQVDVLTTVSADGPDRRRDGRFPAGPDIVDGIPVVRHPFVRAHLPAVRALVRVESWGRRHRRGTRPEATGPGRLVRSLQPLRTGPLSWRLARAVRRTRADVLVVSSLPYAHLPWARRAGVPYVVLGALHQDGAPLRRGLARALAEADGYLALTASEGRAVVDRYAVAADRVLTLSPPLDRALLADGGRPPRPGPVTVGHLGREVASKQIPVLLEAMAAVWDRSPDVRLLLGGAPGNATPEVLEWVAALPAERRRQVRHLGPYAEGDKAAVYAEIDVFVSASATESYGLTFLEAASAGCAVVGTRSPAIEEVVVDGVEGVLVEPGRVADLAEAIVTLVGDPELRRRLGSAARARVTRDHAPEAVAASLHGFLADVVARSRPSG